MDHMAFAREWAAGWNAHDLPRILSHYRDDVVFRSAKARALTGSGTVTGKPALAAYWRAALDRQPELRFTVQDVFAGADMMVITYTNHAGVLAAETLRFDGEGRVIEGSACHRPA